MSAIATSSKKTASPPPPPPVPDGEMARVTLELRSCQRRVAELEQHLEAIASLLHWEGGRASADPQRLIEQLASRLTQLGKLQAQQRDTIDQLSRSLAVQQVDEALDGNRSRRNVVRRVEEAVRRSQRFGVPLFCLMIGIDRPEELRAAHGSRSYDFLLVQTAQRLQRTLRQSDVLMRNGDEEFLLISDSQSIDQARGHAARLVRTVCAEPLEMGPQRLELSLSIAIIEYQQEMGDANDLIRLARESLQKAQSRNVKQLVVRPL